MGASGLMTPVLAQDRVFFDIPFPLCQGIQHPLASLAVFDSRFARPHQIVIGPDLTLTIESVRHSMEYLLRMPSHLSKSAIMPSRLWFIKKLSSTNVMWSLETARISDTTL